MKKGIVGHSDKNNGSQTILTAQELRAKRRASGLSIAQFARLMGLRNRSSLIRYETGQRQISRRFARRLEEWESGSRTYDAEIVSSKPVPPGTILPDGADFPRCEWCDKHFVRMNRQKRFHDRSCQLTAWRWNKRKEKNDVQSD
jgi:transcriptional regulator with XRE-family HTH domain